MNWQTGPLTVVQIAPPPPKLLLDNLSVAPFGAYSTRKLSIGYTGFALRASQSNTGVNSVDQDIGFTANGDLDTASLISFIGPGNNGWVRTWYDQSGNGNDMTGNPNDVRRPLIIVSGTLQTQNGHAWLTSQASITALAVFNSALATQPLSYSFMHQIPAGAGAALVGDNVTNGISQGNSGGQKYSIALPTNIFSSLLADTNTHCLFGICNGASSQLILDGVSSGNLNPGTNGINASILWVAGPVLNLGEVLIHTSVLSGSDQAIIRSSWQSYWGTP